MNKDRIIVIAIVALWIVGVTFLCISMFGEKQDNHHPLPIAMSCIFAANALIIARNKKKKQR
ncbi:MAG: hypothetical protein ACOCOT_08355 [Prevotella sp.]|nr:hypothetical protein [Prevotella sp.]